MAIVTNKACFGADPDETILILIDCADGEVWKFLIANHGFEVYGLSSYSEGVRHEQQNR